MDFSLRFSYFLFSSPLSFTNSFSHPFAFYFFFRQQEKKLKSNFLTPQETEKTLFEESERKVFQFFSSLWSRATFCKSTNFPFSFPPRFTCFFVEEKFHRQTNRELYVHTLERLSENWTILAHVSVCFSPTENFRQFFSCVLATSGANVYNLLPMVYNCMWFQSSFHSLLIYFNDLDSLMAHQLSGRPPQHSLICTSPEWIFLENCWHTFQYF